MRIADILPKNLRICVEQSVSDMRIDYFETLLEKKQTKAEVVVICFYINLVWSILDFVCAKIKSVIWFVPKSNQIYLFTLSKNLDKFGSLVEFMNV